MGSTAVTELALVTPIFPNIGADLNGWFLAAYCCSTPYAITNIYEAELRIVCVNFRNISTSIQIIISNELIFFTEISPRTRSGLIWKHLIRTKVVILMQSQFW